MRRPEKEFAKFRLSPVPLPDNAARELTPCELQKYCVIRVADEIVVDLMKTAGGIDYEEASRDIVMREIGGVPIPFASPRLLRRMKAVTQPGAHREPPGKRCTRPFLPEAMVCGTR